MGTVWSNDMRADMVATAGGWTYTPIATDDFTIEWAVGTDDTNWAAYTALVGTLTEGVPFPTASQAAEYNAIDSAYEVAYTSYMFSLKLGGLAAAGDGVVLLSETRGAVVVLQNAPMNGVTTYRYSNAEWSSLVATHTTNKALVEAIVDDDSKAQPSIVSGFDSVYTA